MAEDEMMDYGEFDYFEWFYVEDDYPLAVSDAILPLFQDFCRLPRLPCCGLKRVVYLARSWTKTIVKPG
jgi:hypothetical protein